MKEEYIKLTLPLPISVNCLYSNARKGRIKTEKYKSFISIVTNYFNQMDTRYIITGKSPLRVDYVYYMPCFTKKDGSIKKVDVFNFEKSLSDTIEKNLEGFKDENIFEGFVKKIHSDRNEVEVTIREIII